MKDSEVIKFAGISERYLYYLLEGRKTPSPNLAVKLERATNAAAAANQREEQLRETNLLQRLANLGSVVGQQAEQVRAEEQYAKDHNLVYTGDTSIPANALVRGDKVQVRDAQGRPDVATVRGSTDDGRIILQDGVRMTFGENEDVPIQGLSLNEHAGRQQQGWGFKTKAEREQLRQQKWQRKAAAGILDVLPRAEQELRQREQQREQARQDAANEQTRQANRAAGQQWMAEQAASNDLGPADGVTRANRAPTSEMESMFPFMPETEQAATPTQPAAKTESKTARAKREAEELKQAKAVSPQWNERLSKTQNALSEAQKAGDQKAVQQLTGQLRAGVQNALKMQAERNARATAESQEQTRARMDRSHAEHEAQVAQYLREQGEHIRRQWIDLTRASVLPDFARNIGRNRVPAQARSQEAETTTGAAEVEDALNLFMLAAQSDEQRAQVSAVRDELARQPETAEEARWQRSMRERLATAGRRMRDEMRQREGRRLPAPQQGQSTPQTRTRTQPQERQEAPKQIEYKPQPTYPGNTGVQQGQPGLGFRPKAQRQAQAQALIPYMPQETRGENAAPAYPGRPQVPAQNYQGGQNTKNAATTSPVSNTGETGRQGQVAIPGNVMGGFGFRNLANRQENAREERAESVSTREEAQGNTPPAAPASVRPEAYDDFARTLADTGTAVNSLGTTYTLEALKDNSGRYRVTVRRKNDPKGHKSKLANTLRGTTRERAIAYAQAASADEERNGAARLEARDRLLEPFSKATGIPLEQLRAEYDAVAERYYGQPKNAPNGEPTNLTVEQWSLLQNLINRLAIDFEFLYSD